MIQQAQFTKTANTIISSNTSANARFLCDRAYNLLYIDGYPNDIVVFENFRAVSVWLNSQFWRILWQIFHRRLSSKTPRGSQSGRTELGRAIYFPLYPH